MEASVGATDPQEGALSAELLATEIRRRLGSPPQLGEWPLVSIVVPNRDGAPHLRRLLAGLLERTDYPRFELILIDNGSSDESIDFIRSVEAPFPISIFANVHNESFSDACNQGAAAAFGELLLFLNNDVEPFEPGWLRELTACLRTERTGIAGATLVYPAQGSTWGYRVQHRAIRIRDDSGLLGPDRRSYGAEPFGEGFGEDADSSVPTGACMLIERNLFEQVGGFTHGYVYGGEDIDLGLKVLAQDRRVVCSGRSILVHRHGSTRARAGAEERRATARGNQRLFWERWGPRVRREYELIRLSERESGTTPGRQPDMGTPTREETHSLGFCLKSSEPASGEPSGDPLSILHAELARRGHRCTVLRGGEIEDLPGLNYDVAVHLRGPARYVPKPAQLNVLWVISHFDALTAIECNRYDLVLIGDDSLVGRLRDSDLETPLTVLKLASANAGDTAKSLIETATKRVRELGFPLRISSPPVEQDSS